MNATITGIDQLLAEAQAIANQPDPLEALLAELARVFVQEARRYCPVDQGTLRDSITARVEGGNLLIQANPPYAVYVLQGLSAKPMVWLLGKTVSFIAKDGTRVTRRVTFVGERNGVRHWYRPTIPAQDFFRQAWESGPVTQIVDALRDAGMPIQVAFLYSSEAA
jgi:hypothetical protein